MDAVVPLGPMKDVDRRFHAIPEVVSVVELYRGIAELDLHGVVARRAMREAKHGVGGQAGNHVERANGFGDAIDLEGQREGANPFVRVMCNPHVECRRLIGQRDRGVEPHRVHPHVGHLVGAKWKHVPARGRVRGSGLVHVVARPLKVGDPERLRTGRGRALQLVFCPLND